MREVEFLPERIRHRRARRRRLARQGYLLAVCIIAMAALSYSIGVDTARARVQREELKEYSKQLAKQIEKIPPLERELAELLIKKRIESELGSRTDCTAVLAELCRIMPENMAMVSLDLKSMDVRVKIPAGSGANQSARASAGGAARTTRTVRRARLVITGVAPTDIDVANFIGQLSGSCVFENVKMGYAKTAILGDRMAREFQASCYLAR